MRDAIALLVYGGAGRLALAAVIAVGAGAIAFVALSAALGL